LLAWKGDHATPGLGGTVPENGGQLSLLGGFQLRHVNGVVVVPASARRVLAYLALHGPSARPVVAGTLWPDVVEERAHGSLRSVIWRLGRLGHQVVDSHSDMLSLSEGVGVDVQEFAAGARRLLAGSTARAADGRIILRQEKLLPGWHDDWVHVERERLRQLQLHALEAFAAQLSRQQRHAAALEAALLAVRLEPLRESAHRTVLAVHLAEGDWVAGIRHFESFRALLHRGLGIEPSERMRAMVPSQ
jgi:DNA-binding SARP family transcriptional activator